MNREDFKKHKDLIEQWADGAQIEFKAKGGEWIEVEVPWWSEALEYRVKERDLIAEQLELIDEVYRVAGIDVITCGSCGTVLLARREAVKHKCHRCGFEGEACDFPDYLY